MHDNVTPFPVYPPKVCGNPDCKNGEGDQPATFIPTTPWQRCCSAPCRNHQNYLIRKAEEKKKPSK